MFDIDMLDFEACSRYTINCNDVSGVMNVTDIVKEDPVPKRLNTFVVCKRDEKKLKLLHKLLKVKIETE